MTKYPCRWPECAAAATQFARGNLARYGHLCHAHWYGFLTVQEQAQYALQDPIEAGAPLGNKT